MNRIFSIIVFLIVFCSALKAQFNNDFFLYSQYGKGVYLHGEYNVNSNALTNGFINKFYNGGYIDSTLKNNVRERLLADNRLGGNVDLNLMAVLGKDSSEYSFLIGIKHQEIFNGNFTRDMFNVAFYGNKNYLDRKANFSNSSLNYYQFQELKAGIIWNNVDTTAKMGIAVSYLKGQDFLQLKTNNTDLYTNVDGTELIFSTNANLSMPDTLNRGFGAFNGHGASAEFFAELPYRSKLGRSKFFLSVSNLGFIRWNKNTMNYSVDSSYNYKGVYIQNLFQISDSTLNNISKDSLIANNTHLLRNEFSTNLPTSLFILHRIDFTPQIALVTGFRHLFQANHKPYVYAEGEFLLTKGLKTGLHVGWGGYGRLSTGLWLSYQYKNAFALRVGSNNIHGYFSPANSLGQGAYFTLVKIFGKTGK